jgi:long-chain acyl-CoA synthetase
MLTPLSAGAAIVLPEGVSGPQILRALREGSVRTIVGVPRLYEALLTGIEGRARAKGYFAASLFRALLESSLWLRKRLGLRLGRQLLHAVHTEFAPKLRVLASGGAKLSPDIAWRLEALGWKVLCGYGLVETASIATFNPRDRARIGSAGLPAPGVEMKLDSPDEQGRGEVLFRGPNVFRGYRDNPEANRQAFTSDGWFRTGDLGATDEDGFLTIVGRVKEMIVTPGGKNVAPEEVEAVYAQSEYAREVAVLDRNGALVALVAPELEAVRAAGSGRIEDLIRVSFGDLSQRLPTYKRISDFVITREALPRTHLGKYRRHQLAEIFDRAERGERPPAPELSAADQALLEQSRAGKVWEWLRSQFPDRAFSLDSNPQLDLGIDSLAWVHLSMDLENRLRVSLSEEAIARILTVRDLLEEVERAPEAKESAGEVREEARKRVMADRERWFAPPGPGGLTLSAILYGAVWLAVRLPFRLRVEGLERVPLSGPFVIAANHTSDLDPFVLGAALSFGHLRRTYWGADADRVFGTWLGRRLSRVVHLFPVHDRAPGASLDMAAEVLSRGHILVWFPEEFRSPTGELQRFLPGIGKIVERSGAAVVPTFISGTFEAMPRNQRLPRPHPVRVRFGSPIPADRLQAKGEGDAAHVRIADALHGAVAALADGHKQRPGQPRSEP